MELIGLYALVAVVLGLQVASLQKTKRPKGATAGAVVLDTCALIDGRVLDLAKAGFLVPKLYVPRPVIDELQYLADNGDAQKRSRARYGLGVVQDLQSVSLVSVDVSEFSRQPGEEVDALLIRFAQEVGASLYTTDYNLNKVARIHGVSVLNVNELAHALRPVRLPGETITVKIVQKGEANTQGVGYLEDGTMAVVDGAAKRIGEQVSVSVDRMIQTEAGKMVFAGLQRGQVQQKQPRKPHYSGAQKQVDEQASRDDKVRTEAGSINHAKNLVQSASQRGVKAETKPQIKEHDQWQRSKHRKPKSLRPPQSRLEDSSN